MQLRQLGHSGLQVSAWGLGGMTFGGQTSAWDARQIMDTYVHAGGNLIDTANSYNKGLSESVIGQWMSDGGHRPHIILSTKTYLPEDGDPNHRRLSRHAILFSVEQSLRRLQTDYIDLYSPHYWDTHTPLEETLSALESLLASGKVRYIACSNYASWQAMKALSIQAARGWSPFIAMHAHYSLLERGIEREITGLLSSEKLGLLAWSPLGGGFLSGKFEPGKPISEKTRLGQDDALAYFYRDLSLNERGWAIMELVQELSQGYQVEPVQIALAWVRQKACVTSVLIGVSQIHHMDTNLQTLTLSEEDMARLDEISATDPGYPAYMPNLLALL